MKYDAIIIGAGAAGLMCAQAAAQRGRRILILEHRAKAGEKIRISGGGKCNVTNLHTSAQHYIAQNPHFCKSALARFTPYDMLAMLDDAGIAWHERDHGQIFCNESAQQVTDMLLQHCHKHQVHITYSCDIHDIEHHNDVFHIHTSQGSFESHALVVASGGLSIPKIGASHIGHRIAQQFGLKLVPPRAGLVPFRLTGQQHEALKNLAGISLHVRVHCRHQSFEEAMLFTHRGLSGPAILQISSYWQEGDLIDINLLPHMDLLDWLNAQQQQHPKQMLHTALAYILPKRLVAHWCQHHIPDQALHSLSKAQLHDITQAIQHWQLKPSGNEGYRTAEVTLGGVDTQALSSKTMQAQHIKGLYFIGEVVDVTGHLGGFNFQWAWASAYAAAQDI